MERINIEDARIRVEFLKNETNEVVKSEWFDVVSYINRAKDAYMGYYENIDDFIEGMFDAQYPDCPPDIKYYIDYSSFQRA